MTELPQHNQVSDPVVAVTQNILVLKVTLFLDPLVCIFLELFEQSACVYIHRESKKRHQTLVHNFTKYLPIFKIFPLLDSVGNL